MSLETEMLSCTLLESPNGSTSVESCDNVIALRTIQHHICITNLKIITHACIYILHIHNILLVRVLVRVLVSVLVLVLVRVLVRVCAGACAGACVSACVF